MTSTIQFWMDIMLNNILPEMDDQFLMDIMLNNILPEMDDQYNPIIFILDRYYAK